jgi:condensin complex subunit 1
LCREAGVNSGQASLGTSNGTSRKNKDTAKDKAKQRRMSIRMISKSFNTSPALSSENDSALEEEMGLHGAEAEDVELLFIETVINTRVAQSARGSPSTLAQLLPMVVLILKDPSKYPDEQLQLHCSLTLVKLMLLSQKLCTENLQLLFTLMEKSTIENVRSQLILGVGDLVYRFPNALEPWTGHLYLPLRDTKSSDVRMNTIRVLSHLILKEMIKTRGQIYEIALCTIDKDTKIASLAKRFFSELSQRNNGLVIYNAMPDIISQLSGGGGALNGQKATENESDDEQADADRDDDNDDAPVDLNTPRTITEDNFRTVVTYLFTFIKKDKQCETLIEKLCHAFRLANTSERKCRDLVFCLSKIQLSESGIKKLKETFKWYSDKLTITAVYDTFKNSILKNARKLPTLKNETKMLIDELEKQIEEVKRKGVTDEGGEDAAGDNLDVDNNNDAHAQESENVPANPSPAKRSQKSTRQVAATRRSANTAVKANNQKNKKKSIAANFAKKKGKNKENSSSESSSSSAENEEEEDDSD